MGLIEWGAVLASMIYLYFAIKNKVICFVFGAIGSLLWAWASYSKYLYFDAGLQLFYVGMSILGIVQWKFGKKGKELPVSDVTWEQHLLIISNIVIFSNTLYLFSKKIDFINFPILDALTTVMMIAGTLLLVRRKISSWIYLVIADVIYIYIYSKVGLWLFVGMMVVYVLFGTMGYISWKKIIKTSSV